MLQQTYQYKAHHATGAQQIERTGLKKAQGVNEAAGKSSRDKWGLKQDCEMNVQTDSIQWMTRNELRKAKRNKNKF